MYYHEHSITDRVTLTVLYHYPQLPQSVNSYANHPIGWSCSSSHPHCTSEFPPPAPPSHDICEYFVFNLQLQWDHTDMQYVLQNMIYILYESKDSPHTHVFYVLPISFVTCSGWTPGHHHGLLSRPGAIAATCSYHDPPLVQVARCPSKLYWNKYPLGWWARQTPSCWRCWRECSRPECRFLP